jgi:hypothetical protein
MPRRSILTERQRAALFDLPTDEASMLRHFTLADDDLEACAEALEAGLCNGDVILAILARQLQPPPPPSIITPEALALKAPPLADCGRYDSIRKVA